MTQIYANTIKMPLIVPSCIAIKVKKAGKMSHFHYQIYSLHFFFGFAAFYLEMASFYFCRQKSVRSHYGEEKVYDFKNKAPRNECSSNTLRGLDNFGSIGYR